MKAGKTKASGGTYAIPSKFPRSKPHSGFDAKKNKRKKKREWLLAQKQVTF